MEANMHWLTDVLGLALVLSPFILGYAVVAILSDIQLRSMTPSAVKIRIRDNRHF